MRVRVDGVEPNLYNLEMPHGPINDLSVMKFPPSLSTCHRLIWFLTGLLALPAVLRAAADVPAALRPNIIFINVDDLGWADVGCYGSKYYETPAIDRLAAEGMKFTDAYAAAAICSPTRAAMLTGRYPARLGLTDYLKGESDEAPIPADRKNPTGYEKQPGRALDTPVNARWLDLDEVTMAEVLKQRDYRTAHIGKWHLGSEDWWPEKQGFDVNLGGCDYGKPPTYFDPFNRTADNQYKEPPLKGIPHLPARKEGEYLTDREAAEAVNFIRENKDQPFLLNLWHYAVHEPIQAKPELVKKYEAKEPQGGQKNPTYAAMIESVDQALARIVSVLDELDLASRTVIVFTSDNGGLGGTTSNAPLRGSKGSPLEGGIRVPLIVRWPGVVEPGSVCAVPVNSIDFLPTFAEIAGAKLPEGREIDGESLVPLLRGESGLTRQAIFWHFPHYRGEGLPYSIVRKGDWKLIRRYVNDRLELYNLREDISEKNNLSASHPEKVAELNAEITEWIKNVGARMPRPAAGE